MERGWVRGVGWGSGVVLSPPECLELRVLFFFKIYIYYFFSFKNFFGHAGSSLPCVGFSLVAESGFTLQVRHPGFSLWWPPTLWSMGSRHSCFSGCGSWAQ